MNEIKLNEIEYCIMLRRTIPTKYLKDVSDDGYNDFLSDAVTCAIRENYIVKTKKDMFIESIHELKKINKNLIDDSGHISDIIMLACEIITGKTWSKI